MLAEYNLQCMIHQVTIKRMDYLEAWHNYNLERIECEPHTVRFPKSYWWMLSPNCHKQKKGILSFPNHTRLNCFGNLFRKTSQTFPHLTKFISPELKLKRRQQQWPKVPVSFWAIKRLLVTWIGMARETTAMTKSACLWSIGILLLSLILLFPILFLFVIL